LQAIAAIADCGSANYYRPLRLLQFIALQADAAVASYCIASFRKTVHLLRLLGAIALQAIAF
jgi:hypothetical protein